MSLIGDVTLLCIHCLTKRSLYLNETVGINGGGSIIDIETAKEFLVY